MNNLELAEIFDRIASLLEIKGEVKFKYLAYRRAAENIRNLSEDVLEISQSGNLTEVPGIGSAIAKKIDELLSTGKLQFLEKLELEVPPSLLDLLKIPDVGPKKVSIIWQQAGITNLSDLEAAARQGKLQGLPGIGAKSEQRILKGIESLSHQSQRILLGVARPTANQWKNWLNSLPGVRKVEIAGSLRRWKETIGDLDFVAVCDEPEKMMQAFIEHPDVGRVLSRGENKSSIELKNGLRIQLWIQPLENYGSLLQFVTGSQAHNVRLRELAKLKGLSLSEKGYLDENQKLINCPDEEMVYRRLGLEWIPPEMREDRGEIQAAVNGKLPGLIQIEDLKADLHTHSTWSDGSAGIEEMALAALQRGRKILAITDHSQGLGIAGGLDAGELRRKHAEIKNIQNRLGDEIQLLHGAEVEIHADGSLDYPDEVLAELDLVIASIHTSLHQPREAITARLIRAIQNPFVKIIGHPSGRLILKREGADLDWPLIMEAALKSGTALEINANPDRLDLSDVHARRAFEMGVLLSINSDAHAPEQMDNLIYGVAVARRAWIQPQNIINTWPFEDLKKWLSGR